MRHERASLMKVKAGLNPSSRQSEICTNYKNFFLKWSSHKKANKSDHEDTFQLMVESNVKRETSAWFLRKTSQEEVMCRDFNFVEVLRKKRK